MKPCTPLCQTLNVIPAAQGGSYLVALWLRAACETTIGRLGAARLPRGYYIYIGSAKNGLAARLHRHVHGAATRHWHLDYLRPHAGRPGLGRLCRRALCRVPVGANAAALGGCYLPAFWRLGLFLSGPFGILPTPSRCHAGAAATRGSGLNYICICAASWPPHATDPLVWRRTRRFAARQDYWRKSSCASRKCTGQVTTTSMSTVLKNRWRTPLLWRAP